MLARPVAGRGRSRQGVVLIVVTGLAMVLLGIAVSFMLRMRADSLETRTLVAEAQARVMLHAAMMYLQETSRIGWGDEAHGWTDLRDGSLGPRPPRNFSPASTTGAAIPPPSWWKVTWGPYIASPTDAQLPPDNVRSWPCPGSVARCPMAVPVQAPYATQMRYAYNPVRFPAGAPAYGQAGWDTAWINATTGNDPVTGVATSRYWPVAWADDIFDPSQGSTGVLDPQPQADVWRDPAYTGAPGQTPDFISGAIDPAAAAGDWTHVVDDGVTSTTVRLAVRDGTENVCWFRIYREVQADHDGLPLADPFPKYDRVVLYDAANPTLKNWNVFLIACGSGPSRGYRFWDEADIADWESANGVPAGTVTRGQELASASPIFAGLVASDFHAMRAATRVLWYRVEWSPMQGGGWVPERYSWAGMRRNQTAFPGWNTAANAFPTEGNSDILAHEGSGGQREGGYADGVRYNAPKIYGGNFKWVQRLDHEPPNW